MHGGVWAASMFVTAAAEHTHDPNTLTTLKVSLEDTHVAGVSFFFFFFNCGTHRKGISAEAWSF